MERIEGTIERIAGECPDKTALSGMMGPVSYAELLSKAAATANVINRVLPERASPVGVLLPNSPEFVQAVLAVWLSGKVVVPMSATISKRSMDRTAETLGIHAFITDKAGQERIGDGGCARVLLDGTPEWVEPRLASSSPLNPLGLRESHAVVFLTSGTTGPAKVVALSHENLLCNVAAARACLPEEAFAKSYVCVPMCHSYGFTVQMLSALAAGGELYVGQGHRISSDLAKQVISSRCSSFFGVPASFRMLVDGVTRSGLTRSAQRVRCLVNGASSMTEDLLSALRATFTGARICLTYGLSEASPLVTALQPAWVERKGCAIGVPVAGVELRILTDDGQLTDRPGVVGEILIKGKSVIDGYLGNAQANSESFHNGYLKTGDFGVLDEDGCVRFRGRRKDLINRAGEKIYPCDIEEVLLRRHEIEEAAVVPLAHPVLGEVPFAFVKLADGRKELNAAEIRRWCAAYLSPQEIPTGLRVVEAFPRTATGKVRKQDLVGMLDGRPGR